MQASISATPVTMSLPARGAWIEIGVVKTGPEIMGSRSPHGERGLKFIEPMVNCINSGSLPARGAWIEMFAACMTAVAKGVAPRTGSVD